MKNKTYIKFCIFLFVLFSITSFGSAVSTDNLITGYATFGKESRLYERIWMSDIILGTFDEFGSIVVENDILYFASKKTPGNLTAMNATDGSIIWSVAFDTTTGGYGTDGTPLLDNQGDYLYINTYGSYESNFYKYYKSNGTKVCNYSFDAISQQSMDQSDTMVFDTYYNGTIVAFNKDDCSVNWTYSISGSSQMLPSTPLYVYEDDSVVVNTKLGNPRVPVVKLNATTGELIWNSSEYGGYAWYGWDNKPSYEDNILYMPFGNGPGAIAYYYNNGSEKWVNLDIGSLYTIGTIDSDSFYVGGANDIMYKLNKTSGTPICAIGVGGDIYNGLIVTDYGIGVIGSLGKVVIVFNTTNCDVLAKIYVNGSIYDMMTISKGNLYFKSDDGRIYAFKLGSGTAEYTKLGFDINGTNLCTDCLTTESYATILCNGTSQYKNITCNITNLMSDYTSINNFSLQMPYTGWLYYSNGTKINSEPSMNISFSTELNYNDTLELIFERGYYNITNCAELQAMKLTDNYKLANDINCSGVLWNTIGVYSSNCLVAVFDGQNHVIYNLRRPFLDCIKDGTVKNVGFVGCNASIGSYRRGVVANVLERATIENVFVKGSSTCLSNYKCGGIGGDVQYGSTINNSYALLWNYTFGSSTSQGGLTGEPATSSYSFSAGFLRSNAYDSLYDSNKTNVTYGLGIAKTTEELKTLSTFTSIPGWNMTSDNTGYWHIDEGRYPCFNWTTVNGKCPDYAPTIPLSLGLSGSEFSVGDSISASASGTYDLDLDDFSYYYKFYDVNEGTTLQDWSTTSTYEVQPAESGHIITVSAMPVSTINGTELSSNVTILSKQCGITTDYNYTDGGDIDCIAEGLNVSAILTLTNTTIFTDYVQIATGGKIILDSNSKLVIS